MPTQKSFKVIIEDITDPDPTGTIKIPTREIQEALIGLGLGKIKPMGGMNPYSRYSIGNPQKYFISIVVHFENTINKNLRNSIEQGNIFILKYRYIQNLIHNNQNNNYIDKTVIIKKYT